MGELIERDIAVAAISAQMRNREIDPHVKVGLNNAKVTIQSLAAVDAAPVVHAGWIETTIPANTTGHGGIGQDKKKGILCSECRCAFDINLLWINDYCPHCGAKMDKGDSNG